MTSKFIKNEKTFLLDNKKKMAKILFVDDDTHTLSLMEQIALILGHDAILCPAAKNAMNMAIENEPDLIMIDINMQELNGFDIVKDLRKHETTSEIPIMILSASEPDFETNKAINVGANGFISKPLTIHGLETVLGKFDI